MESQSHIHFNPKAHERYQRLLSRFKTAPDDFFLGDVAGRLDWIQAPTLASTSNFDRPVKIEWFRDGLINASVNCLDRHLDQDGETVALHFEPDDPADPFQQRRSFTYRELHLETCLFAEVLSDLGVKRGDCVTIYMPMIAEALIAVLACARIGAVHSVVFGGFSAEALKDRILDAQSKFLIAATSGRRGGKSVPILETALKAVQLSLDSGHSVQTCLVVEHPAVPYAASLAQNDRRCADYSALRSLKFEDHRSGRMRFQTPQVMNAEDPLFLLYTSGSTGKPKGVVHTTGGYLAWASFTHSLVFDLQPTDIYWCTADLGWITGHSYLLYGPLTNRTTSVVFEGVPNWPDSSRIWNIVDRYHVSILYTAPTAIRSLMKAGNEYVTKTSRKSLRVLGTVGEPINPEAWTWYYEICGNRQAQVVDTWWQTETGGILISACAGATTSEPGSAGPPLPGVEPVLLESEGQLKSLAAGGGSHQTLNEGRLCLGRSWPGQMRTVHRDHQRFEDTYFAMYPGYYFTGDGAKVSANHQFTLTGRVDDVLNVAGHRIGTAEVESALIVHPAVAESAVVGFPHEIKGQGISCFVTLKDGVEPSHDLARALVQTVREVLSPIATPDQIQWAPHLPKTRSGKIMRRILRKIAEAGPESISLESFGDISTLADPSVVDELVKARANALK